MQNFFYSILTALLIVYVITLFSIDSIHNMNKLKPYNNYIVTDKNKSFLFHNLVTLRKDTLSYTFSSEDIVFDSLKVGDTIKVK